MADLKDRLEPNLFKYIWHFSKAEQTSVLILVALSMPFYFLSLNLPKLIVNQGIQGEGFTGPGSTQTMFRIEVPWSQTLFGRDLVLFDGVALEQMGYLIALSFVFLLLVIINGLFKLSINTLKGRMGERMLRRLRFTLADRLLRFPLPHLRRVKQSEAATMIKDEVEPLGGFIGDAYVTPAFLGGQALTAMIFIMVQSLWLGGIALAIVGCQAFIIPKLRRRILELGRERQLTARQLAGRVGEIVDGAQEIHANDASNYERADLAARLGRIFFIRYEIYRRKFFVKFLNNFLGQLTPFVFFCVGGVLALYGRLDIGTLVAVINAYKDLPGPVKELIDWDQQRNDVEIKYEQVIEQFQPPELIAPALQKFDNEPGPSLTGEIVFSAVSLVDDSNARLLESVSFSASLTSHVAVVGPGGGGKDEVALVAAALRRPTGGAAYIGGRDLATLPSAVTGRRIAYVGPDTYHFPGSVRDNVLYGLRHRPLAGASADDEARRIRIEESRRAGNPIFDLEADWTDYAAAGATGPHDIEERILAVLHTVSLEEDVYRMGLYGTISPGERPDVAEAVLKARAALPEHLAEHRAESLIERFAEDRFNAHATVAENILFGTPRKPDYKTGGLAENELFVDCLRESDVYAQFLGMGLDIAKTMVEIFADLPPGHPFFEQFSFIGEDDLPVFRQLIARADPARLAALPAEDRGRLLGLLLMYIEARHRLGLIDDAMSERIVAARRALARRLEASDADAVEPYRIDSYNSAASIQDNVLFGRIAHGRAGAQEVVSRIVGEVLRDLGVRGFVTRVGLDHQVGIGGKRLSATQRQKLGLARALVRNPDLLVLNEPTGVMDTTSQRRIMESLLSLREGKAVLWTVERPEMAAQFDKVLFIRDGRVAEYGTYEELKQSGSALSGLLAAE